MDRRSFTVVSLASILATAGLTSLVGPVAGESQELSPDAAPTTLSIRDKAGDLKGPESEPTFIDLKGATISTNQPGFEVRFDVAAPIPDDPGMPGWYNLSLDLDGDDIRDMTFSVGYLQGYDQSQPPQWRGIVVDGFGGILARPEVTIADEAVSMSGQLEQPVSLAHARIRADTQAIGSERVESVWGPTPALWEDGAGKGPMRDQTPGPEGVTWPPVLVDRMDAALPPAAILLDVDALRGEGSPDSDVLAIRDALLEVLAADPDVSDMLAYEYQLQSSDFAACDEQLRAGEDPLQHADGTSWMTEPFTLSRCLRAFAAIHATSVLTADVSVEAQVADFVASSAARYPEQGRERYVTALQDWVDLVTVGLVAGNEGTQ